MKSPIIKVILPKTAAPKVRMLPRWLNQRSSVARMSRTHGPAEGSEPA